MSVKILHKRSAVEFKNATGAQLEFGELALNYNESGPYLQCKDTAGEIINLGGVYLSEVGADAQGIPCLVAYGYVATPSSSTTAMPGLESLVAMEVVAPLERSPLLVVTASTHRPLAVPSRLPLTSIPAKVLKFPPA